MQEDFAVVFRDGAGEAAGALEVEQDRLLLRGRSRTGHLELEIPFSDLSAVRVARPRERIGGYRTLVLERTGEPAIQVAPLGLVALPEIADLLASLANPSADDVLAIAVPLKPGCRQRAHRLLKGGPPIDPAELRLRSHEVFLDQDRAIFVFRGSDAQARISSAFRHPDVWRAGLAWQACFAGPPQIIRPKDIEPNAVATYQWHEPRDEPPLP